MATQKSTTDIDQGKSLQDLLLGTALVGGEICSIFILMVKETRTTVDTHIHAKKAPLFVFLVILFGMPLQKCPEGT